MTKSLTHADERLIFAVEHEALEVVEELLLEGASPNAAADGTGWTVLMIASTCNRPDVVELLLAKGADPGKRELRENATALMWASRQGFVQVMKILHEHGAAIDDKGLDDWTALTYAAKFNHDDAVQYLLEKGADPKALQLQHLDQLPEQEPRQPKLKPAASQIASKKNPAEDKPKVSKPSPKLRSRLDAEKHVTEERSLRDALSSSKADVAASAFVSLCNSSDDKKDLVPLLRAFLRWICGPSDQAQRWECLDQLANTYWVKFDHSYELMSAALLKQLAALVDPCTKSLTRSSQIACIFLLEMVLDVHPEEFCHLIEGLHGAFRHGTAPTRWSGYADHVTQHLEYHWLQKPICSLAEGVLSRHPELSDRIFDYLTDLRGRSNWVTPRIFGLFPSRSSRILNQIINEEASPNRKLEALAAIWRIGETGTALQNLPNSEDLDRLLKMESSQSTNLTIHYLNEQMSELLISLGTSSVAWLKKLAKHKHAPWRAIACEHLGRFGEHALVEKAAVEDRSKWVRFYAARGLTHARRHYYRTMGIASISNALCGSPRGAFRWGVLYYLLDWVIENGGRCFVQALGNEESSEAVYKELYAHVEALEYTHQLLQLGKFNRAVSEYLIKCELKEQHHGTSSELHDRLLRLSEEKKDAVRPCPP